ncbi:MAG: PDZ domain-containing protein [Planctomycetes bacterium]|nr:PDZ domain-containing protein [Planctomycetota bacterium]
MSHTPNSSARLLVRALTIGAVLGFVAKSFTPPEWTWGIAHTRSGRAVPGLDVHFLGFASAESPGDIEVVGTARTGRGGFFVAPSAVAARAPFVVAGKSPLEFAAVRTEASRVDLVALDPSDDPPRVDSPDAPSADGDVVAMAISVHVASGDLSTSTEVRALRLEPDPTATVPPPSVLLQATRIATLTSDARTVDYPVPVGSRWLIGATRYDDHVETWRVVDRADDATRIALDLPSAEATPGVAVTIGDPRGEALIPRIALDLERPGRAARREPLAWTRLMDGRCWLHLPRLAIDVGRERILGRASLDVSCEDHLGITVSLANALDADRDAPLSIVLAAQADITVSLEGVLPPGLPLAVTLDPNGSADTIAVESGRARFDEIAEGPHRLVVFTPVFDGALTGRRLVEVEIDVRPGSNSVRVPLPPLHRLRLEVDPATPAGDGEEWGARLEHLVPDGGDDDVPREVYGTFGTPVDVVGLPAGNWLLHLLRPNGRPVTSRWIELDRDLALTVDTALPNALLVWPIPGGAFATSGFERGDVITAVDGRPLRSRRLQSLLLGLEEGTVNVTVRRGATTLELPLDLEGILESPTDRPELRPIRDDGDGDRGS